MAASKKSAKRSSAKKRPAAKSTRSKKSAGKAKAGAKAKAGGSKRRRKSSRAASGGLDTVRQVGEKTWETLKSRTAQVVEGVKDTFGG